MVGVDAKPIMAAVADNVVIAGRYSVLDAVDQAIRRDLSPMEAGLFTACFARNNATSFSLGCGALVGY